MKYAVALITFASLLSACSSNLAMPDGDVSTLAVRTTPPLPRAVVVDQTTLDEQSPNRLSANFVDRVIHDLPVQQHLKLFAAMDPEQLDATLNTQAKQVAFWLNIYNGYTQYFLKADPTPYLTKRSDYFGAEQIDIAGSRVSLEQIEHGVLRRGATIYTTGFVRLLFFRRGFIKRFAVNAVDYRIHFALNCGAKSCPPVLPYEHPMLDEQLDANSRSYLLNEVQYNAANGEVLVPRLMGWFSADFGGTAGAKRDILKRYGLIPQDAEPDVEYLPYDWTIQVENYAVFEPS